MAHRPPVTPLAVLRFAVAARRFAPRAARFGPAAHARNASSAPGCGFQSVADLVDSEPSLRVIVTFNDISMVNWRTIWGPYPGLESEYPLAGFVAKMSTPAYAPARTEFGQRSAGSTVSGTFADDAITADEPDQRLGRLTGHLRVSAVPNHGILITITGTLTFDASVTKDQALAYLNAIHDAWNTGEKYKGVRYAVRTSLELDGRVSMFNPRGTFHVTDCGSRCGPSVAYGASIPLRGLLMRSGIELAGTEAHEFGHVLGLDHRTRASLSIMNSYWDVPGRRVSGYDLYRLEQLYGR